MNIFNLNMLINLKSLGVALFLPRTLSNNKKTRTNIDDYYNHRMHTTQNVRNTNDE